MADSSGKDSSDWEKILHEQTQKYIRLVDQSPAGFCFPDGCLDGIYPQFDQYGDGEKEHQGKNIQ